MSRFGVAFLTFVGACRDGSATPPSDVSRRPNQIQFALTSRKLAMFVVDTARMVHSRVIATLPALVVANEDHTVRVATPVTGRIVALLALAGDRVSAGQPLARIRSGDIAQVTSEVEKARTAERAAGMTLARSTDLYEHKLIASREIDPYAAADDLTLFVLRGSAHCHNMATTRVALWCRIASWLGAP